MSELIRKILAEHLFGVSYEKLTPLWQGKISETIAILSREIVTPFRLMNNALLDTEQQLLKENTQLKDENKLLKAKIDQLNTNIEGRLIDTSLNSGGYREEL